MQFLKYCCGALMTVLAAGCGSGTNAGSSTAYSFVSPKVNSQQIYSQTTVDNSNNTIYQTTRNTVTAINADGSYDLVHDDPSGSSTTVNGTTYSTITESIRENSSGQEIEYMAQPPPTIVGIACTVSPHGAGPNYPLTIGQAWTSNYSVLHANGLSRKRRVCDGSGRNVLCAQIAEHPDLDRSKRYYSQRGYHDLA